jgi:hypothetical protein
MSMDVEAFVGTATKGWRGGLLGLTFAPMTVPPSSMPAALSKITLLALTEALEARFDAEDWNRLAVELEIPQLGDPEMGFQRALRAGDDDYGYQVAQFVSFMENDNPRALRSLADRPQLSSWLREHAPNAAQELALGQTAVPAPQTPGVAREVDGVPVDADQAPHSNGAVRALAGAHAALHGDLRAACAKAKVPVPANASIGLLFNTIRNGHPSMAAIPHDPLLDVVLGSLAVALTAGDALRNNGSPVHPTPASLGDPEALLVTDLMHALARYLEARL